MTFPGLLLYVVQKGANVADSKPLISGNWKMNCNHLEAIQLVQKLDFKLQSKDYDRVEICVHPPFTDLRSIQTLIDGDKMSLKLGAQNCSWFESGAYTGEVSPSMLAKLNVSYVIVGHSERRELFGETDEIVRKKLEAVLRHNMSPILCVGDTLEEYETEKTQDKVFSQIQSGLKGLSFEQLSKVVVAYEPIWAIGTGHNATPSQAQATCSFIRSIISDLGGSEAASVVRIQYGGSVRPGNAHDLLSRPDINGLLVGSASLDADSFAEIINFA